jgi:DNA helicase-2/ATP-dependent DNA helicase PcrA
MYVGITRAKRKLYLTNAYQRLLFGMTNRNRPSRFVGEIPEECVEITSSRPSFGGFGSPSFGGSSYGGNSYSSASRSTNKSSVSTSSYTKPKTPSSGFGSSFAVKPSGGSITPLKKGDRVKHKTFGGGVIVEAVPTGGDVLLTIQFDSIGSKKLMQKFAKLEKE